METSPGISSLAVELKKISSVHLLAGETAAGANDCRNTAARWLHPAHPNTKKVLTGVARLAGEMRRLDSTALDERLQSRGGHVRHLAYWHADIYVKSVILSSKGGKDMALLEEAIGRQFEEQAQRLGLSQVALARITGISRRHIAWAYHGGNISLALVLKLMQALQMTHLSLGGGHSIDVPEEGLSSAAVALFADRIEKHLEHFNESMQTALAALRAGASSKEKPRRSETGTRAAALVREVTASARRAKSRATANALESELTRAVEKSEDIEPLIRRRRR